LQLGLKRQKHLQSRVLLKLDRLFFGTTREYFHSSDSPQYQRISYSLFGI
jgi:hypothetical protein